MAKLDELLRQLKYEYLCLKEGVGGHAQEWREYVVSYYRLNSSEFSEAMDELLGLAATPIWRERRASNESGTHDLFVCGHPCADEIRYADKSVPGGYTTVLISFATIEQFRRHCMVLQSNANKVQLAAIEAWETHKSLYDLAGGDESRRVADFFDADPPIGDGPEEQPSA